jgi:predicted phage terminase large subunit-like protein
MNGRFSKRTGKPDFDGEPSFPEVFTRAKVDRLEQKLGRYMFSCLCMNKPLRSEDMVFQPHWIREYDANPTNLLIYTTVDPAGDPEDSIGSPDYNVVMTCGKDMSNGNVYVLDYFRERCHPGRTLQAMFDHARLYFPLKMGVESVAYQKTLLYYARQKMIDEKTYFQMEPINNSRRSKNARIMGLQPLAQRGQIHIRPWMRELVSEMMAFPLGANDDIIDALSMQLELMAVGSSRSESTGNDARNDP